MAWTISRNFVKTEGAPSIGKGGDSRANRDLNVGAIVPPPQANGDDEAANSGGLRDLELNSWSYGRMHRVGTRFDVRFRQTSCDHFAIWRDDLPIPAGAVIGESR